MANKGVPGNKSLVEIELPENDIQNILIYFFSASSADALPWGYISLHNINNVC